MRIFNGSFDDRESQVTTYNRNNRTDLC